MPTDTPGTMTSDDWFVQTLRDSDGWWEMVARHAALRIEDAVTVTGRTVEQTQTFGEWLGGRSTNDLDDVGYGAGMDRMDW
jgi:hypothetical protein